MEGKDVVCVDLETLRVSEKISAIDTLMNYASAESQMYWQRNSVFITINSAMIGLYVAVKGNFHPIVVIGMGLFGQLLSYAWIRVMIYGKFFAEKWREDARYIARTDESLIEAYSALLNRPRVERPSYAKPSVVMRRLGFAFQVLWGIVMCVGLYSLYLYIVEFLSPVQC